MYSPRPTKTKEEINNKIKNDIKTFLEKGGSIQQVPRGVSGKDENQGPVQILINKENMRGQY